MLAPPPPGGSALPPTGNPGSAPVAVTGAVVLPQMSLLYLVTAKMGGIPRRGPTTRLAALDAGRIPNRKGTSRCV